MRRRVFATWMAAMALVVACADRGGRSHPPRDRSAQGRSQVSGSAEGGHEDAASKRPATPEAVRPRPRWRALPDTAVLRVPLTAASVLSRRSWALKVRLRSGARGVFKPDLRRGFDYRAEVAFFRLAASAGLAPVPRAVVRSFYPSVLRRLLPAEDQGFFSQVRLDAKGRVVGALVEWMEAIEPAPFRGSDAAAQIARYYAAAPRSPLAGSLAAVVLMDYVTGNWDRFSGGNLFVSKRDGRAVPIDHNAAFGHLSELQLRKLTGYVDALGCVPKDLVALLRTLDDHRLQVLMRSTYGDLLSADQRAWVLERTRHLVAHLDAVGKPPCAAP